MAAIHAQHLAVDEARLGSSEEGDGVGDLRGLAVALERAAGRVYLHAIDDAVASNRAVLLGPGLTALTRAPSCMTSAARQRVRKAGVTALSTRQYLRGPHRRNPHQ
jgi:hypothetical protein